MKAWFAFALLLAAGSACAQSPRVLLDTDRGPILIELDTVRAPITSANFLAYVDAKTYDNTLFHRIAKNFVVQGGGFRDTGVLVTRLPTIASERNNGLLNRPGTISMGLSNNSNGSPNHSSASSDFFFSTGNNTRLDPDYTVFGSVVYGLSTISAMNNTPLFNASEQPIRPPLLKRAVRVTGFPVLDVHTGSWFDPAKSGRGFGVEISKAAGNESGPLLVVYWYDYFEGEQVWMNGVAPFQWGASEIKVPLQITRGAQFGEAFDPADVVSDGDWGELTVRFTACDRATFSYESSFGNGTMQLQRLTLPTTATCTGG